MSVSSVTSSLAQLILQAPCRHPIRVGINGVDASGKTILATSLTESLRGSGRKVIQVSIDGFHNPKTIRYRKGRNSPEGFYRDSFDNSGIIKYVLRPLGPGGNLKYKTAIFDFKTDSIIKASILKAKNDSILLMEGVFLFHSKLVQYWDLKIFVDVDFDTALRRAIERDREYLGSREQVIEKYKKRYMPGEKLYFQEVNPKTIADIVIDNNDFNNPVIKRCLFL